MIVVIGAGVAGLAAAITAREEGKEVLVIHRGWSTGSTYHAQGGIAAALRFPDSLEAHARDTLEVGQGLADLEAVRVLCQEGPDVLRKMGIPLDPEPTREGGHRYARVWHTGHDRFGRDLQRFLIQKAQQAGVQFLQAHVKGLGVRDEGVVGVWVETTWIPADGVVLATGGYAALWEKTSNPPENQGEGLWMAAQVGARLRNVELVQFHPTWLAEPPYGLVSETVRGAGARLRTMDGETFMHRYHPLGDLAPRDVVTRAILEEMRRTGSPYVLLDLSPIPRDTFDKRFPHIAPRIAPYWPYVPVRPAAHYSIGGVVVDLWGRTEVPRLLAAGEVAWSGVHGANRLGSNSLLEGLVWGRRAGMMAAQLPPSRKRWPSPPTPPPPDPSPWRKAMDQFVGPIRSGEEVAKVMDQAEGVPAWVAQAAWIRQESRGVHQREDFPHLDTTLYHVDGHWVDGVMRWERQLLKVVG